VALTSWIKHRSTPFYGWRVIGVSMMGGFMAASASQIFMGVMLKPITEDLGWTRSAMTGAITLGTIGSGLLAPFVGRLADRHGPRLLAPIGVLALSGALVGLASVNHLWQFYVAYIIGRSISQTTLSGDVPRTTAVNWFRRKRGRALGMTQMALPMGGSALSLIGQFLLGRDVDWRTVFLIFSVVPIVVLLLPMVLVLRRRPEDLGLLPDGETQSPGDSADASRPGQAEEHSWSLREVTRTPTFWFLIAGNTVGVSANGAVGFHMVAYFTDQGIGATFAVVALSVYALSGAFANGMWGFLVERFPDRLLAVGAMASAGVLTAFLLTVSNPLSALIFAVLFGLSARGQSSLVMMIVARYFGRRNFGAISGFMIPFQMVGLGLGPLIASVSYDVSGTYTSAFTSVTIVYAVTAVLLWSAKEPHLHQQKPSPPIG
jgi:OFA family oxalate/formate antiporter-like MFS transporter